MNEMKNWIYFPSEYYDKEFPAYINMGQVVDFYRDRRRSGYIITFFYVNGEKKDIYFENKADGENAFNFILSQMNRCEPTKKSEL